MKKGDPGGNSQTVASQMISLGPQSASVADHQTLLKAKARLEKNGQANNCMVMPISDARLSAGLIPVPYPLNFMPNFLKMGVPYPFPPAPGALSPSMVNMASFGLMRELEVQATKLKEEAKALANNSSVRNTIGLGAPTVVSHQIEMTNLALGKTNTTSTTNETNLEEETESSSANSDQSSDSDFEDEERVLVRNWEKDRCDVAWRWSWLQLQMEELKRKLKDCEKEEEEMIKKKHKYVPEFKEEDGDEKCVRTSGFAPLQEKKKLVKREPSTTVLNRNIHSVLKVKVPKRKHNSHYEDEDDYKPNHKNVDGSAPKKKRNPTPLRVHTPIIQPPRERPLKLNRSLSGNRIGSPKLSDIKIGSPKIGSPSKEAFSPRTRRARKRDEYSVDNVVIPFSGTLTPRVYKDIVTPSWQEIGNLEPDIDAALIKATEEEESIRKKRKLENGENFEAEKHDDIGCVVVDVGEKLESGEKDELENKIQKIEIRELTKSEIDEDELTEPETDIMDFPPNFGNQKMVLDIKPMETKTESNLGFVNVQVQIEENKSIDIVPNLEQEQPNKGSIEPSDDTKDLNSKGSNPNVRLLSDSTNLELDSLTSDEDTSDEAFAQRHFCRELLERKRYLFPDKNRNLPTTPDQLPPEFFVASLSSPKMKKKKVNTAEEMEKLKKKFEKIRGRYINELPPSRNWEDLRHLATLKEVDEEEEEYEEKIDFANEWDSGCSDDDSEDDDFDPSDFDKWEFIQKPTLYDDQGRERNIIYLRRVFEAVAVVE